MHDITKMTVRVMTQSDANEICKDGLIRIMRDFGECKATKIDMLSFKRCQDFMKKDAKTVINNALSIDNNAMRQPKCKDLTGFVSM
jgi:hypothetical protein